MMVITTKENSQGFVNHSEISQGRDPIENIIQVYTQTILLFSTTGCTHLMIKLDMHQVSTGV